MDVILERILEKKAEELGITKAQAVEIYKSLFAFIRKTTAEGNPIELETYKSVYIKDLGIFYPKLIVAEKIGANMKLKLEREANEDI